MHRPSTPRIAECLEPGESEAAALERMLHEVCLVSRQDVLTKLAVEHLVPGGKRLRAHLALAAAEALGVETDPLPWAAACELIHNASLVHDDIQDRDAVRRGRPAIWVRCGVAQAINLGDLLLMLPATAVGRLHCPDSVRWRLMAAVARRAQATVRAQARELELRRDGSLDLDEWRRVAAGKTGELFALPVEGAALIGGAADQAAAAMGDVFRHVGVAYQLADDVADGDRGSREGGAAGSSGELFREIAAEVRRQPALADRPRLRELAVRLVEGCPAG